MKTIGVAKFNSMIELTVFENSIRDHLNKVAPRRLAVFDPVKLVIDNFPEDLQELIEVDNNPEDENAGTRSIPFEREVWVERDDFRMEPPPEVEKAGSGG